MPTPLEELAAAHRTCTRFLAAHGPVLVAQVLEELVREVRPDERPDGYGEGPLIREFEAELAAMFGKPAALFLPSGTMAQQIAARIHTDRKRLATVAWHPTCHLEIHEERGYQAVHGLRARLIGDARRPFTRADLDVIREPVAMLLIELPQREIGGVLPSAAELEGMIAWARERDVALHLDGARLWECTPFYGKTVGELAAPFDSVYVSFYKTLRGIAGAALAGPADFVAEARVWQRRLGGNLVSLWPLVVSARAGLRERLPRMRSYRERAVAVARVLTGVGGVRVNPDPPHINMMHVFVPFDAATLATRAAALARRTRVQLVTAPRDAEVPGWCRYELAIGDAAGAISDEELAGLCRELFAPSGAGALLP